jgi:hypothetical protein
VLNAEEVPVIPIPPISETTLGEALSNPAESRLGNSRNHRRINAEVPAMKAAIIAGCVVLSVLTTAPGAHADSPKQTVIGEWYFNGMVAGFVAANETLSLKGQPQLFCPPEKLTLTGEILQDLMRKFEDNHPEIRKHASGEGMVAAALLALEDAFPCKPQ